jgi:O-methyltransferase
MSIKSFLPEPIRKRYIRRDIEEARAALSLLAKRSIPTSRSNRWAIIRRAYQAGAHIPCPHTQSEIFAFIGAMLALPRSVPGVVVEAGCFKGGSTAKFSLAAPFTGRNLVVFDSFQGMPDHGQSQMVSIVHGKSIEFAPGSYCGTLDEVKNNVGRFGQLEYCRFIPGWFDETMPTFNEPIAAIYLDCDLGTSTATCLKYLYPLLSPGGVLFSQDGHVPEVVKVFREWPGLPQVEGLGKSKLIHLAKPLQ